MKLSNCIKLFALLAVVVFGIPCAFAQAPAATISPIQSCGFQAHSTPSVSCTFPNPIGAGHFLFGCLANVGSMGPIAWSGDSGTFTADPNFLNVTFNEGFSASCFYVPSTGGGGQTITATSTSLDYAGLSIDEYPPVGAFDISDPGGATGTGTTATSNPITPTSGDLILGFQATSNNPVAAAGTGFTLAAAASGIGDGGNFGSTEYAQGTGAAIAATFNLSVSGGWVAHVAAFRPVAPATMSCTPAIVDPSCSNGIWYQIAGGGGRAASAVVPAGTTYQLLGAPGTACLTSTATTTLSLGSVDLMVTYAPAPQTIFVTLSTGQVNTVTIPASSAATTVPPAN
jgi:hypothetical protein